MLPIGHDIFDVRDVLILAAKCMYKKKNVLFAPPSNSSHQDSRPSRLSQHAGQIHQVCPKSCAGIIEIGNLCRHSSPLTEKGKESIPQTSRRGVCNSSLGGLGGEPAKNYDKLYHDDYFRFGRNRAGELTSPDSSRRSKVMLNRGYRLQRFEIYCSSGQWS